MRENFEGVTVFVEVMEAGSFALAAERLALSRSAVAKAIGRIETRLGVRLFHRTTRTVNATEAAQIYYERCLRAVDELRQGADLLESGRHEVSGKLRITMPLLFGRYCVAPILVDLAGHYPKLELDMHFSDHIVDLIGDRYDLAIRNHTPGDGTALESKLLASQGKVVCAAPSYIEQYGSPETIEDLQNHQTLAYLYKGGIFPWTFSLSGHESTKAELHSRLQFDSYDAIADAAISGAGIACLPDWLVKDQIKNKRLVPILTGYSSPDFDTYAVWPATRYPSLKLRRVVDALSEGLHPNR